MSISVLGNGLNASMHYTYYRFVPATSYLIPEGTDPEADGGLVFYEFYLEILQAFALTRERSLSPDSMSGDDSEHLLELMERLGAVIGYREFGDLVGIPSNELNQRRVLSSMRTQTKAVRNWAYLEHMHAVTGALAAKVHGEFFERYGVDPVLLMDCLLAVAQTAEDRWNNHLTHARHFYRQNSYQKVAASYAESFPDWRRPSIR